MRRWILTLPTVIALWGAAANFADAQFNLGQPPPRVRPTVSPAINIGTGGAFSYYGYIKPQTDATRAIMDLRNTVSQLNPDGSMQGQLDPQRQQGPGLGGLQTGHSATFFNTGGYFPNTLPGGGATLGGAGFGSGLGGYGSGLGITSIAVGTSGNRVFFPTTLTPGIRP
jgi:hypothetical protein